MYIQQTCVCTFACHAVSRCVWCGVYVCSVSEIRRMYVFRTARAKQKHPQRRRKTCECEVRLVFDSSVSSRLGDLVTFGRCN